MTNQKKPGRKPREGVTVAAILSPAEAAWVREQAEKKGDSLTSVIRGLVGAAMRGVE